MAEDGLQAATTARAFREELIALYTSCGSPSHLVLSDAAREFTDRRIAKSTLYDLLNRKYLDALPKLDFVTVVVTGCLALRGEGAEVISEETARWAGHWRRILSDQDEPIVIRRRPSPAASPSAVSGWRRWRWLAAVVVVASAAGLTAGVAVATAAGEPPPLTSFAPCAEAIKPDSGGAYTVLLLEPGPPGNPYPNRLVELRTQVRDGEWIVWAHLEKSTAPLDRVWLDWSYRSRPGDLSQQRQCGPQLVTQSAQTPGLLARDGEDNMRWFRACAQVPEAEWQPGRDGKFCTSWSRPDV